MLTSNDVKRALAGEFPERERKLTYAELGEALAPHRRGRYPEQVFGRAYIANILAGRQDISQDFEDAFISWRAAELLRLGEFRAVNVGGMSIDEILQEVGRIQKVGDNDPDRLLLIGAGFNGLVHVNGAAREVIFAGELRECYCGKMFAARSWNHKYCSLECRVSTHSNEATTS